MNEGRKKTERQKERQKERRKDLIQTAYMKLDVPSIQPAQDSQVAKLHIAVPLSYEAVNKQRGAFAPNCRTLGTALVVSY
jgi:hypothetical protein